MYITNPSIFKICLSTKVIYKHFSMESPEAISSILTIWSRDLCDVTTCANSNIHKKTT